MTQKKRPATPPADVVNVIDQARAAGQHDIALYVWLVAITGVRRGELCAVQIADIDLSNGVIHIAFNYVVKAGQKLRKDTKTHQERHITIDSVPCALIQENPASVSCIRSSPMQPRDSRRVPELTRRGPFSNDACRGIGSRRARFRSAWWCHR